MHMHSISKVHTGRQCHVSLGEEKKFTGPNLAKLSKECRGGDSKLKVGGLKCSSALCMLG